MDPTAPSSWDKFHPAYGVTIGVAQMAAALDQLGPTGFARAYGNRWPETMGSAASPPKIPPGRWAACQVPPISQLPQGCAVAFGFDTARLRDSGAIAVAWRDARGLRCELIDARPGTGWVGERLGELWARHSPVAMGYPGDSPALDVADALATAGAPTVPVRARDWTAACAGWLSSITERRVRIGEHPALSAAAEVAPARDSGDGGWTWHRRGVGQSIAPITAATAACWALDHPAVAPVAEWTAF